MTPTSAPAELLTRTAALGTAKGLDLVDRIRGPVDNASFQFEVSFVKRRSFLKQAVVLPAAAAAHLGGAIAPAGASETGTASTLPATPPRVPEGRYAPGRISNDYSLFLPGEREALTETPRVSRIDEASVTATLGSKTTTLKTGESIDGWRLVAAIGWLNGAATAVFEKHVTHQGAIVYVTTDGEIARIPKRIGDLSKIRPRPANTPHGVRLERPARYIPGPDVCGDYIVNSDEDPCYENVAALGAELIGWTL